MGAGSPNWAELERLDRLPKNMRHMVPGAAERGELKDRIVELEQLTHNVKELLK